MIPLGSALLTLLILFSSCTPSAVTHGDTTLSVWNTDRQILEIMPLESYVLGAVAEEMPARYHAEALKCQAVAARTYAIQSSHAMGGSGCQTYPKADVCTSSACCQGYLTEKERREKWNGEFSIMEQRIASAVRDTAGEILTYRGEPAEMLYHACSGGITEDASAVFSRAVPYLISVESPGEEESTGFFSELTLSRQEAAQLLIEAFPGCGVEAASLPAQLRLLSSTPSGRMKEVLVGSTAVSGTALRHALGLRSTLCTWDCTENTITFHMRGYGHGVGMSQTGANVMASDGSRYWDILSHYYPGTVLIRLNTYKGQ